MKRHYYTWQDVETAANSILSDIATDSWRPDYIVGITRGGLPLALLLSHRLGVDMQALKVALRDGAANDTETNCWMADDAFGYIEGNDYNTSSVFKKKNILIVDDINDTGATFNWIKQDWQSSCLPHNPNWNTVWGGNVRFATMTENLSSEFGEVNYHWHEINKADEDIWLVYPWEKDAWLKLSTE